MGGFSLLWLNLSPFYLAKEQAQEDTLKIMWQRIGANMKSYNDMVSRSTTSTSLDKDTYYLWADRNSSEAGLTIAEEDKAPYFLLRTRKIKRWKKEYL